MAMGLGLQGAAASGPENAVLPAVQGYGYQSIGRCVPWL